MGMTMMMNSGYDANSCNTGDKHGKNRNSIDHNSPRGHHRKAIDISEFRDDIWTSNVDNEQSRLDEIRNFCIFCHRGVSTVYLLGTKK